MTTVKVNNGTCWRVGRRSLQLQRKTISKRNNGERMATTELYCDSMDRSLMHACDSPADRSHDGDRDGES